MDFMKIPLDYEYDLDGEFSPMKNYYEGKTILLTGGLGFLGQLYVEKLLRSDVKVIYLLARSKKGKSPETRILETFRGPHYSKLSRHNPNYLKRLRIIEGDLEQMQCGISDTDVQLICDNVEIIIHAAADVRFDEKLLKLLLVNLRGTRELCDIARKVKNLQVFSYISTGFSHCPQQNIDEKFYEPAVDPYVLIKLAEKFKTSANQSEITDFEVITDRIISPWPNTYTYSKSLSEEIVRRYGEHFPICVIRPTIVISTFEDPVPAWCNNIYGLNGVLVACGMGVLRLMPLNCKIVGDVVCADFVINSTLASIWVTHTEQLKQQQKNDEIIKPEVYHVSTHQDRPATWGEISQGMHETFEKLPSKRMFWKDCPNSTICPFMWKYLTIFYHVIPGFVIDLWLKVTGKNKRLLPIYRKVQRFMEALKFFMQHEWNITNYNMKRVLGKMSKYDQEFYPSDVRRYDWHEFTYNYTHGLRAYIGMETMEHLEVAKRRYLKLQIAHYFVLLAYYGLHVAVFGLIARKLGIVQYAIDSMQNTYEFLNNPI